MNEPQKKDRPQIEPIQLSGKVKESKAAKVKKAFILKDGRSIGHAIAYDWLIPGIKHLFFNVVTGGLGMSLFGDGYRPQSSSGGYYTQARPYQTVTYKQDYNSVYRQNGQPQKSTQDAFNLDTVVFSNQADAERVITAMIDMIEAYQFVEVSAFYDLVGMTAPYTAENWGWRNLANAKTAVGNNGFYIIFPPIEPIK